MKRNHSIDTPDLVGEPVFESLGSDREVKLLQFPLDRLFQEKFDQHLPRGSRGELNVEGRFEQKKPPQISNQKRKGQWSLFKQTPVNPHPPVGKIPPTHLSKKPL